MQQHSLLQSTRQAAHWTFPMFLFAALLSGCHPAPEEVWEIRQPAGRGLEYYNIAPAPNGDVYSNDSPYTVARMSPNGDFLWRRATYSQSNTIDESGALYSVGRIGNGAVILEKYSPEGDTRWSQVISVADANADDAELVDPILATNEQGTLVFCSRLYAPILQMNQYLLTMVNANGDVAWTGILKYQSSSSLIEGVMIDDSGNIYLLGYS